MVDGRRNEGAKRGTTNVDEDDVLTRVYLQLERQSQLPQEGRVKGGQAMVGAKVDGKD